MTAQIESAPDTRQQARELYRQSVATGRPLTGKELGDRFGMTERWGRNQIRAVKDEGQPRGDEAATQVMPRVARAETVVPERHAEQAVELERNGTRHAERHAEDAPAEPAERNDTTEVVPDGQDLPERHERGPVEAAAKRPAAERATGETALFIIVALGGIGVSVDTSWRVFGEKLGITNVYERAAMFSVLELGLIAAGWAMLGSVQRTGRPGPTRWLAWALCAASAYAALLLSGPGAGLLRVLVGPVLSVVMFHFALGIQLRVRHGRRGGTLARVAAELRERLLSRLGLGDDGRPALERTKARAARRAAHLAQASGWVPFRNARLRRALRAADVAHDEGQRQRMLAELRMLQHATELRQLRQVSPWQAETVVPERHAEQAVELERNGTRHAERHAEDAPAEPAGRNGKGRNWWTTKTAAGGSSR
ncbi:hypothetical protein [Amycolatopsis thermoflava]|uniref:hypothetical protein n=1 Tax=Amycolatopsis thermoflava TaxID=84480 RepID=UPI003EB752CE